jgi:hypothetical protein
MAANALRTPAVGALFNGKHEICAPSKSMKETQKISVGRLNRG